MRAWQKTRSLEEAINDARSSSKGPWPLESWEKWPGIIVWLLWFRSDEMVMKNDSMKFLYELILYVVVIFQNFIVISWGFYGIELLFLMGSHWI